MTSAREIWTDFLGRQVTRDSDTAQENTSASYLCDLPHTGLIKVTGDDARDFLQNQFCNDVKLVNDNFTQLNGYCSPKGRLISFFRLFKQSQPEPAFYLCMPTERIEATLKRLQMFVMMSSVTLVDASNELVAIGLGGPKTDTLLKEHTEEVPESVDTCMHWNGLIIIRVPGGAVPRFLIAGRPEHLQPLWSALSESVTVGTQARWLLDDIRAGIPQVVNITAEAFVPQMLNLQSINALSFKKGCYPGQEIVARMHYLGKQKRRMYQAQASTALSPGDSIVAADNPEGQSVGTVVSSAAAEDGNFAALVVLQIKNAENTRLSPENLENVDLILKDLPYSVELEGEGK